MVDEYVYLFDSTFLVFRVVVEVNRSELCVTLKKHVQLIHILPIEIPSAN